MDRLQDKKVIITGAANGIGRGIALRFAQEGAVVGVLDFLDGGCYTVVDEIQENGGQAVPLVADLQQPEQLVSAVNSFIELFGPPNILVNNAAVMADGAVHTTSLEKFDRVVAVNLRGAFIMSSLVIPHMLAQKQGCILNMASITGISGAEGLAAYSMTKGGLIALTRAMAVDYAAHGIRVNCVSPGSVDSPMLQEWIASQSDPEETRRSFNAAYPIGRIGTIDEVVNVFLFLASDEASFVTGANYIIDGGISVKVEQPQD